MIKKIKNKTFEIELEIKKRYLTFILIGIFIISIFLAVIKSVDVGHDLTYIVPPLSCQGIEDKLLQWDGTELKCIDISGRDFKRYVTSGIMKNDYDSNNGIYDEVLIGGTNDIGPHRACFLESVFEGSPESRDSCRLTFIGPDINDVNGGMWRVDRGSSDCHMAIVCIDW